MRFVFRGVRMLSQRGWHSVAACGSRLSLSTGTHSVSVLRRLGSGETPRVLPAFCGGDGDAEGRRVAMDGVAMDTDEQTDVARRSLEARLSRLAMR